MGITRLQNGYEFVDGVAMHAEHREQFQIPHATFRKSVAAGHFVEVRIDSPRFSIHPDAPEQCDCPHCREPMLKPVLCHEEPASFVDVPRQGVPSRGWGEQFWVRVTGRRGGQLSGRVDNTLYESRLHGLQQGDEILFRESHILAVHPRHHPDILQNMNDQDLAEFMQWLEDQR